MIIAESTKESLQPRVRITNITWMKNEMKTNIKFKKERKIHLNIVFLYLKKGLRTKNKASKA